MKKIALAGVVACLAASPVLAQDFSAQLKARQGQFRIMALNLGILGDMAQGKTDYNAEAAQSAADTLVAVSMIQQGPHWPEGSDNFSIDGTRAQPSIWEDHDDFLGKWADFGEAAKVMQAAAADGQEALGPAMGQIGGTCKACHDNHRAPEG
ncbi:cytochrome c [Lutimaribacter sp. EGI FJ00015]|uniref:Cytochrome c n=1 Tax=Lutimaribacter degradans TaxID=2945989 RepID=A0ACC5ZTC8_9RHOB|nr:cytochrome c [Lutimaribacter sp. EGI FJ00013]MCM2561198.1 cytochrome c [Lutimaribacter sp. EGI FJ00013]MCO0611853.1 cytochrome c [Lutimaribacter sp. EGI FJ00015]MCO0635026.1 cytochrome c [Lutimaribacter sp. EGI FJ00014]